MISCAYAYAVIYQVTLFQEYRDQIVFFSVHRYKRTFISSSVCALWVKKDVDSSMADILVVLILIEFV